MSVEKIGSVDFMSVGHEREITVQLTDDHNVWIGEGLKSQSEFFHSHVLVPPDKINGLIRLLEETKKKIVPPKGTAKELLWETYADIPMGTIYTNPRNEVFVVKASTWIDPNTGEIPCIIFECIGGEVHPGEERIGEEVGQVKTEKICQEGVFEPPVRKEL